MQAPLQPLQDNLESQTYETFERDDTKYIAYEEAIVQALHDRLADAGSQDTDASGALDTDPSVAGFEDGPVGTGAPGPHTTVLMVVGAGRGPLVRAALQAANRVGCPLRVYAVEKNPNAVVTLQHMVAAHGYPTCSTTVPPQQSMAQFLEKRM